MALREAGVARAKIGDCEFTFEREEPAESAPTVTAAPQNHDTTAETDVEYRPGYSKLFGEATPRFIPNAE